MMAKRYVEFHDDGYWVADARVSLDSVVYAFREGQTAESIAQSYPLISLEQIYGAIAFYLANRAKIDAYLAKGQADFEAKRRAARESDPEFYRKLDEARRQQRASRP